MRHLKLLLAATCVAGALVPAALPTAVAATSQLLNDPGCEQGSPNPYWRESPAAGFPTVTDTYPRSGAWASELCGYDGCNESVIQEFDAPSWTKSATLRYWWAIDTTEPDGSCADQLWFYVRNRAGNDYAWVQHCGGGSQSDGEYREAVLDVTSFLRGHPGERVEVAVIAKTDPQLPSVFGADDITLSVDTAPIAPNPPSGLAATAGDGSAWVTWVPSHANGAPVSYTVTASPGGATATTSGETGVLVSGLSNGTSYTFTATGTNSAGTSETSAPSVAVVPQTRPDPATYHALVPQRILDTRLGPRAGERLDPYEELELQVTGTGGVPASGVQAVVLNVTVTNTVFTGWVTVYPSGSARPLASNLNYGTAQTVPNLVQVPVGDGGKIRFYNANGATDVIADVQGYFDRSSSGPAGQFHPFTPARLADTRPDSGAPGSGQPLSPSGELAVQVAGAGGVPATGAVAVALNVTVFGPTQEGWLTVYPSDAARPLASNVNFNAGQIIPNRVIVPIGADGKVTVFNSHGYSHVIVDVSGWYADGSAPAGEAFTPLVPSRVLDSRMGLGYTTAYALGGGLTAHVPVAGRGGVPAMDASDPPSAVVMNVTVTDNDAASYLTVYPAGGTRPLASDLNWVAGQVAPNLVIVKIGPDGAVDLFNAAGNTAIIADVVGFYA